MERSLRTLSSRRVRVPALVVALAALAPATASAENLLDKFFGGLKQAAQPTPAPEPPKPVASQAAPSPGQGRAFCVRSCDGKFFPLTRSSSPARMCEAFCPASPTKVFFGSRIESARTAAGERYADSENAYGFRTALRADCTCNGRTPGGLAQIDASTDSLLRAGDMLATADGVMTYSGIRLGHDQTPELTAVAEPR